MLGRTRNRTNCECYSAGKRARASGRVRRYHLYQESRCADEFGCVCGSGERRATIEGCCWSQGSVPGLLCPSCGADAAPTSTFCSLCGAALPETSELDSRIGQTVAKKF